MWRGSRSFVENTAVTDILVNDENTFSKKLENKLNSNNDLKKKFGKQFKIFNFAQPANTMLNQITNYVIFGSQIKPELVISHGGVCDFHHGQISDTFLLNNLNSLILFNVLFSL